MASDTTIVSLPPESTIHALLRLLSDPNEQVARTIQDQLTRLGSHVLPFLEQAGNDDATLQTRVAYIKEEIRFGQLKEEFQQFIAKSARQEDWEQGAFLIAKLAYPNLDIPHYVECLDNLAEEFRTKWLATESPSGKAARLLSNFLFKDKGFSGNREEYYEPDNSYLNRVIETRQGIPISLSALYVFVGKRLDLPLAGVGMPGHFLVKVEGETPAQFVDCFNGGTILREQDCEQFIAASGLAFDKQMLEKISTPTVLARMLRNLLSIYEQESEEPMARRVRAFLELLENEPPDVELPH
ncbi:MAG: transglutaminase-like domain-containing protein [Nitrospirota bacterium]|nr:transglutaminase-like domain-containing protein [Nitrospirota bacterium]